MLNRTLTRTAARAAALVATLCVGATTLLPSAAQAGTWPVPTSFDSARDTGDLPGEQLEELLMVEINQARASNGLAPIRVFDACTDRLSERWGRRIAATGAFVHRDQGEVVERCRGSWAGETLVRGTGLTPEQMVELWLDSPGHREILLSPRAERAGVAITQDDQGRTIGVVNLVRHR
ncbi:CAP domain-containing protein [Nocardioides zeicaulis]|uniref:CAP domain-containing protein n=1 Tax=Nocardioides zeicaulis TaxID=1776857 RepID=A0ABV6DW21_9ACTN